MPTIQFNIQIKTKLSAEAEVIMKFRSVVQPCAVHSNEVYCWMDGVKVILGSRGMSVEVVRKIGRSGEVCTTLPLFGS